MSKVSVLDVTPADYRAEKEYLVCIDSDGCAFDTMEIKHKECFGPAIVLHWGLQAISKYAREAFEYVNLYSKSRGVNRFNAIMEVMDLLAERAEVRARGFQMPDVEPLRKWVQTAPLLNNDELGKLAPTDPVLARAFSWSNDVNARIAEMVKGIPPYPFVRESLIRLRDFADVVVVSATPFEALAREWQEHDLDRYVKMIGAQEFGTKAEIIAAIKDSYAPERIIMVGDAPGDQKAAAVNGVLFFPIRPHEEEASWEEFHNEIIDLFFRGEYDTARQKREEEKFDRQLPRRPPWV